MRYAWFLLPLLLSVTGCQSAYYSAMEKVGVHKRDILVDRVEEAQESQQDAQKQFKSALEQFSDLIKFDGGDLQRMYVATDSEYQACSAAAEDVSQRINSIEAVAEALFDEWQDELEQYTNAKLKQDSKKAGRYQTPVQQPAKNHAPSRAKYAAGVGIAQRQFIVFKT